MPVLVQLEGRIKQGDVDETVAFFGTHLPDTRAYDGCKDIEMFLNDDGHTFILIENWDSKAHYDKYLAWRQETGTLAKLGDLMEGPPNIRYFEFVKT